MELFSQTIAVAGSLALIQILIDFLSLIFLGIIMYVLYQIFIFYQT